MVLAQMVVDSVVLEGRAIRATAQRYGVSKSWVHELVRRYSDGGAGRPSCPTSKAPADQRPLDVASASKSSIVAMRKELLRHRRRRRRRDDPLAPRAPGPLAPPSVVHDLPAT